MVAGGPKNTHRELRSISTKFDKNFPFFIFFSKSREIFNNVLTAKNASRGGLKTPKIAPESKKCDFFKVYDIDTTIKPGEKKGQTDVSSAQKRFCDHLSPS